MKKLVVGLILTDDKIVVFIVTWNLINVMHRVTYFQEPPTRTLYN